VVQIDDGRIAAHLDEVGPQHVEETLNALLDAEADRLCGAQRYERNEARQDTRAGSYQRQLQTKAGEVSLKVSEAAQFCRLRRRSSSATSDASRAWKGAGGDVLGGSKRAASRGHHGSAVGYAGGRPPRVSELNQKIYAQIEEWRQRRIEKRFVYVYLDGGWLKRSWGGEVPQRERAGGDWRGRGKASATCWA